ncbi:D-alanine--poly(phosphoribitol) ligase subunit DltC [Liquorilactobacillus sicerae]|uniref:D-alanine--poly(phosphoribitol) ligase subunit DltC n=1 Tax=Liquorilactobacillus sicerae TaxID=1416943 RepID=UPI00247FD908|nr:D-alanine--poly(phosphoribitol) ligase subunit DltC [Liquorilactobacillus sicerae]
MDLEEKVIKILADVTANDEAEVKALGDQDLFKTGFLDSMATVELLVTLQDELGVNVPVSEFDRQQWNTITKICNQIKELQK